MFNEVIIEKNYTHIISVPEPCIPGNVSIVALFIFTLFNFITATWWGWRYNLQPIECLRAASSRTLALACVYLVCLFTCVCAEAYAYVCLCVLCTPDFDVRCLPQPFSTILRQGLLVNLELTIDSGKLGSHPAPGILVPASSVGITCADNFSGFHMGSRDPDFSVLPAESSLQSCEGARSGHNPTGTRG